MVTKIRILKFRNGLFFFFFLNPTTFLLYCVDPMIFVFGSFYVLGRLETGVGPLSPTMGLKESVSLNKEMY